MSSAILASWSLLYQWELQLKYLGYTGRVHVNSVILKRASKFPSRSMINEEVFFFFHFFDKRVCVCEWNYLNIGILYTETCWSVIDWIFNIFFPCIFISDLFHQPNDNTLNFVHLGLLKPTYFLQLKTWKSSHVTFYTGPLVILWSLCVFWVWDLFPIYIMLSHCEAAFVMLNLLFFSWNFFFIFI